MRTLVLITLILILVGLGVVAVENFVGEKKFLDITTFPDQPGLFPPTEVSLTPVPQITTADWKTFRSSDQSFQFHYPANWNVVETISSRRARGAYGITVESWALANVDLPMSSWEGELPENAVKIDFEILTEGRRQSIDNLLNCDNPSVIECKNLAINGVTYKKMVTRNRAGAENISLATIKNDRIYRISGMVGSGQSGEGVKEIEKIIDTFEILQLN